MDKSAKAQVDPLRQRTQYTCVATSVMMALNALGKDLTEDQVNRILGAEPKKGARWEEAIATLQYFGCRGTLTAPSTLSQIKEWTDEGQPVLIAWNPEGRPWSHASCVFHVEQGPPKDVPPEAQLQGSEDGMYVWVADPNIPNPSKTYRIVHEQEFYEKWGEDWGDFIVRRPALMVSLEVSPEGKQVMASKTAGRKGKRPQRVNAPKDPKDKYRVRGKAPKQRNEIAEELAANRGRGNPGPHHTRDRDVAKGRSRKPKHRNRNDWGKEAETSALANELQSSFYKTLDGEALQVTPLRTMPDYGERQMMDIKEMLEQLEQEENLTLNASQMAEVLKTAASRPAGGLYGHTKAVQRDVLASVRKVQKAATKIARTIYAKDKNTFNFLHLHAERSNSLSARILCAAMENIGPKVASTKTAAGHGMYGYRVKTAKLALQACIDISQEAGSVAYDLHTRRTEKYAKITSFLKDHSKRGRCRYARLLLRLYPEMTNLVTASDDEKDAEEDEKEAKHEKGKTVPLSKMPKKLQDNAKDESKHLKSARLMKRQEKVLEKFISRGGSAMFFDDLPRDVQSALRRIRDQETLHMDVDRWLGDHNMPDSLMRPMWAIERAKELIKEAGGCENLPNEAMQKACEDKKKDSSEDGDEDGKTAGDCGNLPNEAMQKACEDKKDEGGSEGGEKEALFGKNPITDAIKDGLNPKKATRTRLTARIANGELQRGEVRFAAEDQEDEDQKEGEGMGRSQLPGEEESNEQQPKLEGNSGYNPGGTEFNGYGKGKGVQAAEADELTAKAEGHSVLPNDEESDKVQPDMAQHGFDAGETAKLANAYETVTSVTDLPDGAKLYWVE